MAGKGGIALRDKRHLPFPRMAELAGREQTCKQFGKLGRAACRQRVQQLGYRIGWRFVLQ